MFVDFVLKNIGLDWLKFDYIRLNQIKWFFKLLNWLKWWTELNELNVYFLLFFLFGPGRSWGPCSAIGVQPWIWLRPALGTSPTWFACTLRISKVISNIIWAPTLINPWYGSVRLMLCYSTVQYFKRGSQPSRHKGSYEHAEDSGLGRCQGRR